mmetsp:Transcript_29726/g.70671  ORF Transcript_29726/g.70671 Transcript_29726/m.70671 type:complete len:248 (-) Transcript_29726:542-1285(-)
MAALAVPPAPTNNARWLFPVRRRRIATRSSTRRWIATQSVLSPTSTREPSAARLTVIVLTAPMRLAASVSMSIRGSTSSLSGIVTEPPPKASALIVSIATLMSSVSQRPYVHSSKPQAWNAALCIAGDALLAIGDPKRKNSCLLGNCPSSSFNRRTSSANICPGAALPGIAGCVLNVRYRLMTRESLPAAPMQSPTAGVLYWAMKVWTAYSISASCEGFGVLIATLTMSDWPPFWRSLKILEISAVL